MSTVIKIKKGLTINLIGKAEEKISKPEIQQYAVKPTDFVGCFPKPVVKEGEHVKAGSVLFFDKYREDIKFTAPVSGTVKEIKRGSKRLLMEIRIESDGKYEMEEFGVGDPLVLSADQIKEKMLKSGVWPMIRQRPYSIIANPAETPKAIFISAFDSAPLAPDNNFIIRGQEGHFVKGMQVVSKLTEGKVHVNLNAQVKNPEIFTNANAQVNYFQGPHPAGNISTQINKIDPINKGELIWYLGIQELITIGKLFSEGVYDASCLVALTGSEVKQPQYYEIYKGASIETLLEGQVETGNNRYISGNVLTGDKIDAYGYLGFYHYQFTVIPEGDYYEFFGWALPGINRFSFSKTFPAYLSPKKKFRIDTNLHGAHRAFVITGEYEKVFPLDIYPMQLIKAILVEDIDQMEALGIYEVDEEDFALCEVIDTSKTEMQKIIRQGLDLMRKEMS